MDGTKEALLDCARGLSLDSRLEFIPEDVLAVLTKEEKLIIDLKFEIGNNKWSVLREQLEARRRDSTCSSKLAYRITQDIVRIIQFEKYEREHHVDLYALLHP